MQPKVFVIGKEYSYEQMFLRNGWQVVRDIEEADAIQFTGGEDVDPMLYWEPKHPSTGCSPARDSREANIFNTYEGEKAMLGICRGGQFLCVMSGGRLWQDVDNHGVNNGHYALDLETGTDVLVSSTHHQMMDPSEVDDAEVLVVAGLTTRKSDGWGNNLKMDQTNLHRDVESVFFPSTQALCFQPHPEFFDPDHPCQALYFDLIKRHLNLGS
jgi:gamma-glutamyl-gamma-aminobutyrate hydrolase PuuD